MCQALEPEVHQTLSSCRWDRDMGVGVGGGSCKQIHKTNAVLSAGKCSPLGHVTSGNPLLPSQTVSRCELVVQGPAGPFKGYSNSARSHSPLVTGDQGPEVL